ncbi:FG-GAP-like repeat-containing protein [Actinomadura verrucosospora]|uniref:FG-GAP repeat domain-containing protein n=1 Tax=Actinomadura verrucosospora TaxID=46165 RepID=A0A7D4ARF6_ACTVE|nr:FG-GAP-like repeat-containing protein [Actinomadura verrucosospora]QKG23249.1 FG-GAP repeat domain-containing protein [Actinomadura verrucosospora]
MKTSGRRLRFAAPLASLALAAAGVAVTAPAAEAAPAPRPPQGDAVVKATKTLMAPKVSAAAAAAAPTAAKLSLKGQYQNTNYKCVPTSASMSLSTFGVSVSQDTLATQMGTTAAKGTTGNQSLPVMNGYVDPLGYSYGFTDVSTASKMMANVSYDIGVLKRAPVLGVWMEKLPWNAGMSGSKVGHAIIAYGYDSKAGTITVWDPWKPTGGSHTISAAKLAADAQSYGLDKVTAHTDADLSAVGDMTGDGKADLAGVDRATGKLWLYPGPALTASARKVIGTGGWNGMTELTGIGDLTGDGKADLVAVQKSDGTLWLYPGGTNALGTRIKIGTGGWNGMKDLTSIPDLTGDGKPDLIATKTSDGTLWVYPGKSKALGSRIKIGNSGWNGMTKLVGVNDITGDGKADLIAVRISEGTLWVYPGKSKALGTRTKLGSGWGGIRSLTYTGDVTGDGKADLIGVQSNTGVMYVYAGRATGFAARVQLTSGWNG